MSNVIKNYKNPKIYTRILDLREDKGLNQSELGKILGISQKQVSRYETGSREIPAHLLIKLANYFETTIDYILYRTDIRNSLPKSNININEI